MNNKLIPWVKPNEPNKLLVFVKRNSVTLGSGALTLGLLLYVVSIVKGVQHEQSEPLVVRDTITVTKTKFKTKVKTVYVNGQPMPKNDAAPVASHQLFSVAAKEYIQKYAKLAQQEQREFGIPASISLAQGLIESRAGTSTLAVKNNNHFGMKCFARNCKKGHCTNHTDDTHKDFFRKFPSAWESWREHSRMISKGRYAKLKKHGTDYKKWAYGLKSVGYATDRTYAEKLIGVIHNYDLHRFD